MNDILSPARPLAVARYQRHYEWTVKEMEQLLSDLVESFRAGDNDATAANYYFMGSFIFHAPKGRTTQIIDGQQRLTSISIILAVARDLMPDEKQRGQIDAYLTIPADRLTGAGPKQRLKLHRGDEAFFERHIVPMGETSKIDTLGRQDNDSHDRLRKNAVHTQKWLRLELSEAERPAFVHFITSACRIVLITVDDEDDAFRIFETVNSRGRPLRSEDVLRVALIEFATEDERKRTELLRKWDTAERRIGHDAMELFTGQWRTRRLKGKRSNKPLHRDIIGSFAYPEEALAFLESELVSNADAFSEISNRKIRGLGNTPAKQAIDKLLCSLALVDFKDWIPLAMLFIERHRAAPHVLLERLSGLDRLAWFYFLKHDDVKIAQDRHRRLGDVLAHLIEQPTFDPRACRFDLSAAEKAEMRGFVKDRIDRKWVPLKPLLVRLEYALNRGRPREWLTTYTIEHILPCVPDSDYWFDRFDKRMAVVTDYAERIGNLCLVTYKLNQAMGSKPFPDKKALALEEDAQRASKLAADFENEADWTKSIIERRTGWLLKVFCDEFDVHV